GTLCRREGEYWTVCFEGSVARLADAKGLRLLARLLADPGREFHAVHLEAASSQTQRPAPARARAAAGWGELQVRPDLGDAGELLDATAKAAYKARLDGRQAELDRAGRLGDRGRAATASAERDFLVGEPIRTHLARMWHARERTVLTQQSPRSLTWADGWWAYLDFEPGTSSLSGRRCSPF